MHAASRSLSIAITLALAGAPASAAACYWGDSALREARMLLDKGAADIALDLAHAYHDGFRTGDPMHPHRYFDYTPLQPPDADPKLLEAQHIIAIAVARLGGEVDASVVDYPGLSGGAAMRQRNLHWAAMTMQYQLAVVERTPRRELELATALAAIDHHAAPARMLLAALAVRDVMPSVEGWALLARLERIGGNTLAERDARSRCEALGGGDLCGASKR